MDEYNWIEIDWMNNCFVFDACNINVGGDTKKTIWKHIVGRQNEHTVSKQVVAY